MWIDCKNHLIYEDRQIGPHENHTCLYKEDTRHPIIVIVKRGVTTTCIYKCINFVFLSKHPCIYNQFYITACCAHLMPAPLELWLRWAPPLPQHDFVALQLKEVGFQATQQRSLCEQTLTASASRSNPTLWSCRCGNLITNAGIDANLPLRTAIQQKRWSRRNETTALSMHMQLNYQIST